MGIENFNKLNSGQSYTDSSYDNRFKQDSDKNIAKDNDKKTLGVNETHPTDSILMCAAETIPPVRRAISIPDKLDKGDLFEAVAAIGLTAINLPEDLRDMKGAAQQASSLFHKTKYQGAYDFKNYQHEFSFFRGTLLEPMVKLEETKNPKLAEKLLSWDKSLLRTNLGRKILSVLKTEEADRQFMKKFNPETKTWEFAKGINKEKRFAKSFSGPAFGKLTARAMARTTKIGIGVMCLLELPKIITAVAKGDSVGEKAKNATGQVVKSGINIATTTAGIAYGGAIGSKYGKGFGSLVGMGVGAILSSKISQKMQDAIS